MPDKDCFAKKPQNRVNRLKSTAIVSDLKAHSQPLLSAFPHGLLFRSQS
jgi:hypothetical protein